MTQNSPDIQLSVVFDLIECTYGDYPVYKCALGMRRKMESNKPVIRIDYLVIDSETGLRYAISLSLF